MSAPLYSVEREFPVSVERLWQAWTDATELQVWYCPVDLQVLPGSSVSEPHVGGLWLTAVDVPLFDMVAYFFGRYTEFTPFERLAHTLHYTTEAAEFEKRDESTPSHTIILEFEARGPAASWVKFTQVGDMPEEQIELTRQGTSSYFDNLEKYLAG